jgi:hypothetical protein
MMPRPRARNGLEELPEVADLAEQIARIRREGGEPAAVLTHIREWRAMQRQPEFRKHWRVYPGDEHTFDAVPVIVTRDGGAPKVYATQAELEDALLGEEG